MWSKTRPICLCAVFIVVFLSLTWAVLSSTATLEENNNLPSDDWRRLDAIAEEIRTTPEEAMSLFLDNNA